jgi:hypothetical protein
LTFSCGGYWCPLAAGTVEIPHGTWPHKSGPEGRHPPRHRGRALCAKLSTLGPCDEIRQAVQSQLARQRVDRVRDSRLCCNPLNFTPRRLGRHRPGGGVCHNKPSATNKV